ncbi:disease resistance protein RPS2 [Vitis vinifera]|uniref:disease resistance protein RPS2 n=1 Tax=Vitis vinifera TaxID=29760 RepID=UPI00053F31D7|nr:disease resistance protein RPS2 [Vitis vinifera]|eukprot:XP_010658104.1 PREDICTED: disease resistance protein RPS2-like [Vitis vinifera]
MNVDEAINVKPLSDYEALNMFKEKVGECISNFPKVTQVAQVVVKECGGLPLLIDKLAKAFKKSSGNKKSVKMTKVLREMALKISQQREDSKFLAKPREGLKEPPNPEEWKQVYRISLMDNELHSLPEALDCCDLVTLLLQRNKNLVAIPEFFFTSMCHLRVLDLHGTGITSLPSSLCNLIGLRVLYLNSCIHLVGLPTDIEALKQLEGKPNSEPIRKCFKLCFLGRVRSSPAWKDFFVRTSPAWEDLSFTFQFAVGYNCLKFINGEGINPVISKVLAKTHAFGLISHKGVSRLSDFGIENMNDLFICSIEGCNEIETIINGTGITKSVFEYLHHLHIKNVLKLESIWQGPVHAESLTLLRTLVLLRCPQLKKIFSNGMIQQLSKLEDLRVEECDQIEEIIMKSENNGLEANQLPRLKTLTLLNLPRLRSIWVDDSLEWRSLQRIEISMCHMLKRLPFNNANATKLRCIEGQQAWWEALQWMDDGAIKQRLESLCMLN